ncbi:DUF7286 family protein [Natronosalvus vescus]|uniref:DUF7286 family protein n=1 Tax=Natronosalvus vescus TaxID=2953881 RepID=UPI0020904BD9|nr:hypothetical protein [Natronosalvus vescus]
MSRPRTVSFAADDRGRIPFALIGVLLLVSSLTIVGALEARPAPETDVDPSVAMDRTTAATQTAIRDATLEATEQVASEPIVEPANTSYGELINGSTEREILENYLKLRIYLNVQDALDTAGQDIRETTTTVSVPHADDVESLEQRMSRMEISTSESGHLEVTIEGVRTTVERDGREVATRIEPVTVDVPSPIFQLQQRTEAYEDALNTGALEGDGFGRQFSGRLYPVAWARGYAQYGGMPVSEVISNRHVEVTANSAAFATQEAVFGTQDLDGGDAMRQAWLCLAATDADDLYGGYNDGDAPSIESDDVCDALQYVYGDQVGGDPPDAPSLQELSHHAPGMDEELTVAVGESAYMPVRNMFDDSKEHSFQAAFDRVYSVSAASDVEIDESHTTADLAPPSDDPHWELLERSDRSYVDITVGDVEVRNPGVASSYYTFEGTVVSEFERTATWNDRRTNTTDRTETNATATSTYDVHVRLYESAHSPNSHIKAREPHGITRKYNGAGVYSSDFSDVPDKAANSFVGGRTTGAFEELLVSAAEEAYSGSELEDGLEIPHRRTISADYEYGVLEADVIEDIVEIQAEIQDLEIEFERRDMITEPGEEGPIEELIERVESERDDILDRSGAYTDPAEKAMYEARLAYLELLIQDLETVADAHDDVMSGVDDELSDANSALSDATSYMQAAMSTSDPEPEPIDEVPLLEGVQYRVSGSPSYLVTENVTSGEVPAVANESKFAPMAAQNSNYFSIPYDSVMTGVLSRIPKLGLGEEEQEVPMRTAGETLRAAVLAEEVGADLEGSVESLESVIDDSIDQLAREISSEIMNELESDSEVDLTDEILDSLEQWESTDTKAIHLGEGQAVAVITEAVVERLSDEQTDEFDDRPKAWNAKVASVTRPIIVDTIAEETVALDGGLEDIDAEIRAKVDNVTDEVITKRLEQAEIIDEEGDIVISDEEDWLTGDAPKRVPAGLPITPVPGYWVATANVWDVNVDAEYARFEVSANTGTPMSTAGTTYVREDANVTVEIGDRTAVLGTNEPIAFEGRTIVVVVVPPGGQGVGDRTGVRTECTESWPESGYVSGAENSSCAD